MQIPTFFLDADDDMGNRAIGLATNRPLAESNLLGELQVALDRLEQGNDGDQVRLVLTRVDMTSEDLAAIPEE